MSYILEALKKAEAERRSGNAPSLHTPHTLAPPRAGGDWWRRPVVWATAVLLVVAGLAAWLWPRQPSSPPVQIAAGPAQPAIPAAAPAAPATPAAPPPPAAVPPAAAVPAEPEKPAPKAQAKPESRPEPKPEPKPRPAPRKQEQKAPAAASATPEAPQAPVPPLRELPEHIQREIPPLQIGGYIYSSIPADRSVLINKRLLREGDEVAPGLTLEKMTPSGMVLNYRGHRYRSSY